jgi:hypothetical protein
VACPSPSPEIYVFYEYEIISIVTETKRIENVIDANRFVKNEHGDVKWVISMMSSF